MVCGFTLYYKWGHGIFLLGGFLDGVRYCVNVLFLLVFLQSYLIVVRIDFTAFIPLFFHFSSSYSDSDSSVRAWYLLFVVVIVLKSLINF